MPQTTLTVGPGEDFSSLSAALGAAQNGDVIAVAAGTYTNDFATVTADVTIEGVGGMAYFIATEPPPDLKGILTVDDNVTIENLSFSGATIDAADGGNAAGIRYEGGAMTLINDAFSNNQDGLLAAAVLPQLTVNTITIDNAVFADNGSGSGLTHNLYVGDVSTLVVNNSTFEGAIVGNEFKSRAETNIITNNVFADGPTGTASYSIDLPDGGDDTVTDNVIEKGPDSENDASVHFGGEGIPYAGSTLTLSGNNFVNDLGSAAIAVLNQTTIPVDISGNTFSNDSASQIVSGPAIETDNVTATGTPLPNGTLAGVLSGNTLIITDDLPHKVTLTGTVLAVEGGGGYLTVTAVSGHVIAIGGSGGLSFTEIPGSGGNRISTEADSANLIDVSGQDTIDSAGTDRITTGIDNVIGQISGKAVISDGAGNDQWSVSGAATLTGHGGNPALAISPGGTVSLNGSLAYLAITDDDGAASFAITQAGTTNAMSLKGGAANVVVAGGTTSVTTAGGSVGDAITFGAGAVVLTSTGADTLHAGSGADTFILSAQALVYAGTGSLSVFGRSDSEGATIIGNGGTVLFGGDSGNLTYQAGAKASTVLLDLSGNDLIGGAGHLTLIGGSDETMAGGAGGLTYLATDGGGADLITTAIHAADLLQLAGADTVNSFGSDTITAGTGNQTINVSGNASITGSNGNSRITLSGKDTLRGVGADAITVTAGASAWITAGAATTISETVATVAFSVSGGAATVSGGSATMSSTAAHGIAIATSSAGRIRLGDGAASLNSGAGDSIVAGAGADTITATASGASIVAGSGALTVQDTDWQAGNTITIRAGAGALTYSQAAGTLDFIGGTGSASIDGDYGSLAVTAGSGNLTLHGGTGATAFVAGSGTAQVIMGPAGGTVTFGSGNTDVEVAGYGPAVAFHFATGTGGGKDIITGFRTGTDTLRYSGVSVISTTAIAGGTVLTLSDGTTVQLMT